VNAFTSVAANQRKLFDPDESQARFGSRPLAQEAGVSVEVLKVLVGGWFHNEHRISSKYFVRALDSGF
jgi:hypothetical protein